MTLDFRPLPYRGEEAVLENHYLPNGFGASADVTDAR